jgi:hypothetical protein
MAKKTKSRGKRVALSNADRAHLRRIMKKVRAIKIQKHRS